MNKSVWQILSSCLCVVASWQVLSAPVQAAEYEVGTVYIYSNGRAEHVKDVQADHIVWATLNDREYVKSVNFAIPILEWQIGSVSGKRTVYGNRESAWPPATGQYSRFRVLTEVERNGHELRSIQAWTCRTGAAGKLSVPAGEFNAIPVICDRYSLNSMALMTRRTWWWSDEVGHYIQRKYQNFRTGTSTVTRLCAAMPLTETTRDRVAVLAKQGC